MKNSNLVFLIIGVVFLGIMGVTNPSQDKYSRYFVTKINRECNKQGELQSVVCTWIRTIFGENIEKLVDGRTERSNLLLFSVYKTQLIGQSEVTTIGVLDNFITVSKD